MYDIILNIVSELKGAWRFRWLAIGGAWLFCIVGWLFVLNLPDQYLSRASVYVDTSSTLRPLLDRLTVSPDVMDQVELVTQALKGRPQLEKVARETGLYLRAKTPQEMDRLVNGMNAKVSIGYNRRENPNLYEISFIDTDPKMAQSVVATLLNLFVEDSLGANKQGTQQAQAFLKQQLQDLEIELTESERELADFKKANVGRMPGEAGNYFQRLQNEIVLLEETEAELDLAERRRTALRDQLSGERPTLDIGGVQSEIDRRIAENQARLEELQLRFTDLHPDIIALKRNIEQLNEQKRREIEELSNTGGSGVISDNPVFQNIQIELSNVNVEIATLSEKRAALKRKVEDLKGLIDVLPEIEAQLTRLTRDYDVKQTQYQALLTRLEVAELSESAEESDTIRFRIVDPPLLPDKPSMPNRPLLITLVLLAALGVGAALAFLASQIKPVFSDVKKLRRVTGLPVLGMVAVMQTRERQLRQKAQIGSYGIALVGLMLTFAAVLMFQEAGRRLMQILLQVGA